MLVRLILTFISQTITLNIEKFHFFTIHITKCKDNFKPPFDKHKMKNTVTDNVKKINFDLYLSN